MSTLIKCEELSKKYGKKEALRNINLTIEGGHIYGLLGPNGSGKTTLMRIIREKLSQREDIRVGYMPQNYHEVMNEEMNPVDYLMEEHDKAAKPATEDPAKSVADQIAGAILTGIDKAVKGP